MHINEMRIKIQRIDETISKGIREGTIRTGDDTFCYLMRQKEELVKYAVSASTMSGIKDEVADAIRSGTRWVGDKMARELFSDHEPIGHSVVEIRTAHGAINLHTASYDQLSYVAKEYDIPVPPPLETDLINFRRYMIKEVSMRLSTTRRFESVTHRMDRPESWDFENPEFEPEDEPAPPKREQESDWFLDELKKL